MGLGAAGGAAVAAGIGAAGSIGGGLIGAAGAKSAASAAAAGQQQANLLAQQRYDTTRGDLLNYNLAGQANLGPLSGYYAGTQGAVDTALGNAQGAIPQIPNQATLLNMPGYQWAVSQGLKGIQSQATANGLGLSGASTKAAENFATGLASRNLGQYWDMAQNRFTDYTQQLANTVSDRNTVFQQMLSPAQLGESAGAQTGNNGANLANTQANALAGAGAAQAAGDIGASKALGTGFNNAGNSLAQAYQVYQQQQANPLTNPNNSAYYGSPYNYNPVASGYGSDPSSSGGQALQSMGFVNLLQPNG